MSQVDYNELLCEAMSIIAGSRVQDLPFDKTIVCTITDNSKKDKGIYTVSDGTITFDATSENTKFSMNDKVYVTIRQNNMSNDKQITGLYIEKDND